MCEQKILEKYVDPVFSPEGVKEEEGEQKGSGRGGG